MPDSLPVVPGSVVVPSVPMPSPVVPVSPGGMVVASGLVGEVDSGIVDVSGLVALGSLVVPSSGDVPGEVDS